MRDPSLFHDSIRGMTRQNFAVDGKISARDGAEPDFMVAFSFAHRMTAMLDENPLYIGCK
jgi:hypothetical protein